MLALAIGVIVLGTYQRVQLATLETTGGDHGTQIKAVTDLLSGTNPYIWTVRSYANLKNDPGSKGYAYLPGIMYTNSVFYLFQTTLRFNYNTNISLPFLMELPSVVASVFIGLFFIKYFYNKSNWAMLFSTLFWFYNPYIYYKHSDIGYDAVTIAFLLWAFYYLEKDDVVSGVLYSLSVIFKTFPLIMIFIFLFKSKNKVVFIAAGIIMFLVFSIPFFKSIADFATYIQGALLVHGDRFVQGRPYLYYISYYYRIEFFRIIPFKAYSIGAIVSGWLATIFFTTSRLVKDKFKLAVFPFILFYTLTPVLNRTYVTWGIPFFLAGSFAFFEKKNKWAFYVINCAYWLFIYWYIAQWKDGFHIWHP